MAKFKDYFNSTTIRGRANVAKATYASFAALYLYTRFRRNKKKTVEAEVTNDDFKRPPESAEPQQFRAPCSECNKDKHSNGLTDDEYKKETEFHETLPPVESNDPPCQPHNTSTSLADYIVKLSAT